MKRRSIILVLLLSVLLSLVACAKPAPQQQASFSKTATQRQPELEQLMDKVMQKMQEECEPYVSHLKLHGGGYLVVFDITQDWFDSKSFSYNLYTIKDGELDVEEEIFRQNNSIVIFYYDLTGGFSVFVPYEGFKGTDYLVYVCPDMSFGRTFETTPDRDYVPFDTLDTKPLMIQDENYQGNCPVWIFDVPAQSVDESYELHYGDFVLTGSDLMSNSWSPPE